MNRYISLFCILFILLNSLFVSSLISSDKAEFIDLDLKELDSTKLNIFKFNGIITGYKITSKDGFEIRSLFLGDKNLWSGSCTSKLSSLVLNYNFDSTISIILKLIQRDEILIEIFKYSNKNVYFGLLDYFFAFHGHMTKINPKPQVLDIADKFDKLYYNCSATSNGIATYRVYESNELDKFVEVVHFLETIWKYGVNNINLYSKKVEVYEQKNKFGYVLVTLENNDILYYKSNNTYDLWVEMNKDNFIKEYTDLKLEEIKNGNLIGPRSIFGIKSRFQPNSQQLDLNDINNHIDIGVITSYKDIIVGNYFLLDDKIVTIYHTNKNPIDRITFNNELIYDGIVYDFLLSLIKTSYGWLYIELVPENENPSVPILYFHKNIIASEWKQITKVELFSYIQLELRDNAQRYAKYPISNYEINNGSVIKDLPQIIKSGLSKYNKLYKTTVEDITETPPSVVPGDSNKDSDTLDGPEDKTDTEDNEKNSRIEITFKAIRSILPERSGKKDKDNNNKPINGNKNNLKQTEDEVNKSKMKNESSFVFYDSFITLVIFSIYILY